MIIRPPPLAALAFIGLCCTALTARAQHGHLNAGAAGTAQGDALNFANGAIFAANSGYVKDLVYTNGGRYAGYFQENITFTALPGTTNNGGPVAGAPALGSFIQVRMESITGPTGGTFSFWENGATAPTISLGVGSGMPSMMWALSDSSTGAGTPGGDPFGHLHGRRFTADQPGLYTVGFRLYDTSQNGVGGGSIHMPSDLLLINFNAVPEPHLWGLMAVGGLVVAWRQRRRSHGP